MNYQGPLNSKPFQSIVRVGQVIIGEVTWIWKGQQAHYFRAFFKAARFLILTDSGHLSCFSLSFGISFNCCFSFNCCYFQHRLIFIRLLFRKNIWVGKGIQIFLPCFRFLLMSAPGNTANSLFIPLIIFMQFAETIEITVYTLRPGLCQPTLAIIGLWLS